MNKTSPKKNILAISGSARSKSSNESLLHIIADLYPEALAVEFYQHIGQLPLFNPDLEKDAVPWEVESFRQQIEKADGVIICTPEYIFSLPATLKNALEWTVSTTVFSNKPVAFIVASSLGEKTFVSLDLIMSTLTQSPIPDQAKLLIQGSRSKINEAGQLADEKVLQQIKLLVESFMQTIEKSKSVAGHTSLEG